MAKKTAKPKKKGRRASRAWGASSDGAEVITKAENLISMLEPHRKAAAQVLIDGLSATKETYDPKSRRWSIQPDFKERRESAIKLIEHLDGKALEKTLQISGKIEDLNELLKKMQDSPESLRMMKKLTGGELPALPDSLQSVSESNESSDSSADAS